MEMILKYIQKIFFVLSISVISSLASAQESIPDGLLPNPLITHTTLNVDLSYNPANGVYTYSYSINSGTDNLGEIVHFDVDISTKRRLAPVNDPDLINDERFNANLTPSGSVPVGTQTPSGWMSAVSIHGLVMWGSIDEPFSIFPGQSKSGFILQSKSPPGPRKYTIIPYFDASDPDFPPDADIREDLPAESNFVVTGSTIGPVLAEELILFDGKGQRPIDVNEFLIYSNPTQARTELPAGVRSFDLIILYGKTSNPGTFKAELNRLDISSKFKPVIAGGAAFVRLDLSLGTNTLVLSIQGVRSDGRIGTDTDRLTFIVP